MSLTEIILLSLSVFFVISAFASIIKWSQWWIRMFDFPRLQISLALAILLIASGYFYDFQKIWQFATVIAVAGALLFELSKIFRYTIFTKTQVLSYKGDDDRNTISLLVSNVLQTNKRADKLIAHVRKYKPDLLLTLETNNWWEEKLRVLEDDYPYTIKNPLENLYGMILYSRLELEDPKIKYLVMGDIPSFEAIVTLNGYKILIHCLHPKPPFPSESGSSTNRDAELLLVGKKVEKEKKPVLIFGDLNDVAWSYTTRLFQKMSEMLDPRIGRGFFNTFHVRYPFFRWPLDHVFHSSHFKYIQMKRLKSIGSDHFPIYIKLYLDPNAPNEQEKPDASPEEEKLAEEKISAAPE